MTFEEILPALKKGNKVIRKGWSDLNCMSFLFQEKNLTVVPLPLTF